MLNRFSFGIKLLAGAAALLLLVIALNAIIPIIRNTAASQSTKTSVSASLRIDPQSCKSPSELNSTLRPPNELYGYELIQGTSFVDGDFSYNFWLYCDSTLEPDEKENLNTVSGLGIFSSWRYNGPKVEGPVEYSYGFEPDISFGGGGSSGPLYKASATGARFVIDIPETTVQAYIQQRTPVKFRVVVNSSFGQNGALLSFNLEPTERGLMVVNLHASQLNNPNERLVALTAASEKGDLDIYSMHADGSGLTNLTHSAARDTNPFWSPDGKRIAFESDRSGFTQIYLMDADGSNIIQLTKDDADHSLPLNIDGRTDPWSPDGSKLLFLQEQSKNRTWMLYSMNINRQNKVMLANGNGRIQFNNISWSFDGKYIGYVLNESSTPDETFVPDIYVVDGNGSNSLPISVLVPENESLSLPYSWSPDEQSISFIAHRHIDEGKDQWIAYQASLDSETLTKVALSSTPMSDWWEGTSFIVGFGGESLFTWLRADGTYSTFKPFDICETSDGGQYINRRADQGDLVIGIGCPNHAWWFYWANPDGTKIKQLLDSPISVKEGDLVDISWSPDDAFIAFTIAFPDKNEIYLLNINESLNNPSIHPAKIVVGVTGFVNNNISWQP